MARATARPLCISDFLWRGLNKIKEGLNPLKLFANFASFVLMLCSVTPGFDRHLRYCIWICPLVMVSVGRSEKPTTVRFLALPMIRFFILQSSGGLDCIHIPVFLVITYNVCSLSINFHNSIILNRKGKIYYVSYDTSLEPAHYSF